MKKTCPICSIEFNTRKSKQVCCSKSCAGKLMGIKNREKRNTTCLQCGKKVSSYPNWVKRGGGKYCSLECRGIAKRDRVKRTCQICSKEFDAKPSAVVNSGAKYCSHQCMWAGQKGQKKPSIQGDKNYNWRGGIQNFPYPFEFNDELKEAIRKRDNHTCQLCGLINEEHILVYGYDLVVHHIDYIKDNCDKGNLKTLCIQCNSRVNYNRGYWADYFLKKKTEVRL